MDGPENLKELKADVDQIIDLMFYEAGAGGPREHWSMLFALSGLLQEASMENGLAEIYRKLAEEFDSLESVVKKYEAKYHFGLRTTDYCRTL